MLSILSWLPIIGPIIEGIVSVFNKKTDATVEIKKIDAGTKEVLVKSSEQTLRDFHDDTDIRLARDIIIFPICLWTGLIVWDKIIEIKFPSLVWGIMPLTDKTGIEFLPYAAITFLLGHAAISSWKR